MKPLYISTHIDGCLVKKVLIDNGAAVNILPSRMLKILGKTDDDFVPTGIAISSFIGIVTSTKSVFLIELMVGTGKNMSIFFVVDSQFHFNALLGRDYIHSNLCVPSSLQQSLLFWNNDNVEMVQADRKPFIAKSNVSEVVFYHNNNMSPTNLIRHFVKGFPSKVTIKQFEGEEKKLEANPSPMVAIHAREPV